jgi:aldehyde:ferredoxin oxidoreductase
MHGGYAGRALWVDLTRGTMEEEPWDPTLRREFIGGYGIAARVLYSRQRGRVHPLGPENTLAIITGPLTGSPAPTGNRWTVAAKSPLTGTWGDANGSGQFGPAMKHSGYDAFFFTGNAQEPVYLHVLDGRAELRDARAQWGMDTYKLDDWVKTDLGEKAEAVCIGPAGEGLSLISGIVHAKGRAAARSGLGAVMGSKHLKAVVVAGSQAVPVADPERVRELRRKYVQQITRGTGFADFYRVTGTPGYIVTGTRNGDSPIKNWAGVARRDFPNPESIGARAIMDLGKTKRACRQCPVACWGELETEYGGATVEAHIPEYETASAFGGNLLNDDLRSIVRANEICNRYGLDSISTGATIAFAFECYEKGIISEHDTGGLTLKWGDAQAVIALTMQLARREGFGEILADGAMHAATKIGKGAEELAIHVGGQELPMHDPRFEPGLGLIYQMDATPGRHTQASQFIPPTGWEIGLPPFDLKAPNQRGRGRFLKPLSALMHIVNCAGFCLFGYLSTTVDFLPEWLSAVTGHLYTLDDLLLTGERIANMRHVFNLREGYNPLRLPLPLRAYGYPPLQEGPTAGISVDMLTMRREYLEAMAWAEDTAKPTREKLLELGLDDVARELWG